MECNLIAFHIILSLTTPEVLFCSKSGSESERDDDGCVRRALMGNSSQDM